MKAISRLVVIALVAGSLLPLTTGAASASTWNGCLYPKVCSYQHSNYGGWKWSVDLNDTGGYGSYLNFPTSPTNMNNNASSYINSRNTDDARWATGQGGGGDKLCLDANSHWDYVTDLWSDVASSIAIFSGGVCNNPNDSPNQ